MGGSRLLRRPPDGAGAATQLHVTILKEILNYKN